MSAQKKIRQRLEDRVIDNGDGTGVWEIQLDGSGIASFDCKIRKEEWIKKPGASAKPVQRRTPPQREE